jgi:hypothetical protein
MKAAGFMSAVLGFVSRSATGRRTQRVLQLVEGQIFLANYPGKGSQCRIFDTQRIPTLRFHTWV